MRFVTPDTNLDRSDSLFITEFPRLRLLFSIAQSAPRTGCLSIDCLHCFASRFEHWAFAAVMIYRLVPEMFSQRACSGSRFKFPVVAAKVIWPKQYGPLSCMWLLRTYCLSFFLSQEGQRHVFHCFLHELVVEISSYHQKVIGPNFLIDNLLFQIRHSDKRTEKLVTELLWSRAGEFKKSFGLQLLDRCDYSHLSLRPDSIS